MGAKRLGGKRLGGKRPGGETTRGRNGLGTKRPGFHGKTVRITGYPGELTGLDYLDFSGGIFDLFYEPVREKTNNLGSDQV